MGYLENVEGPVSLVLDLRITHERFGSSSDPSICINGHLDSPNDVDRSPDKIRKYHAYYDNNPPNTISFMSGITSTSGRLHSEFMRLLFLQTHRETDLFFTDSGVQFVYSNSGLFHYYRPVVVEIKDWEYSSEDCGTTDFFEYRRCTCDVKITHSPITLTNISFINLVTPTHICKSSPYCLL